MGVAIVADVALPVKMQSLAVDQHVSSVDYHSHGGAVRHWAGTRYELYFTGGSIASCSVGYTAYDNVKDGDTVEVRASRPFRNCLSIKRGGQELLPDRYWRAFSLLGAGLLIAAALGLINKNGDFSIRLFP